MASIRGERLPVGGPGRFLLGDVNVLCASLAQEYPGKVDLIYLDPPFGTGDMFSMLVGPKKARVRVPAYTDTLSRDDYLSMLRRVLEACHVMLSESGNIYVHIDYRMSAHIRLMMNEIFGEKNFVNEIIWAYKSGGRATRHFSRKHDTILYYRKSAKHFFHIEAVGMPRGPERRNHMKRNVDELGRVYFSIRSGGRLYTYYEDSKIYPSDVWTDIEHLHQSDPERTGYSTQKPEALLERILLSSCPEGGLVMDLFSGSGTTAVVAARHKREWVAVDASHMALMTLRTRMLKTHREFTLFDHQHQMTLEYPQSESEFPLPRYSILRTNRGQLEVLLEEVEEGAPVSYMALGSFEDGLFLPKVYALFPQQGERITAQGVDTLQLCNLYGRSAFIRI